MQCPVMQSTLIKHKIKHSNTHQTCCQLGRMAVVPVCAPTHWLLLDSIMPCVGGNDAEALAEALYLFQTPSAMKPAEKLAQHCLLFSLTEAHNMAIGWPYPLLPEAESQASAGNTCLAFVPDPWTRTSRV